MTPEITDAPRAAVDGLIERCLRGDNEAWDAIVQLHRRKVYHMAYTFAGTHEEAEDLTQDVLVRVFRSLQSFDRRANFSTWLFSVSRNVCIDHYRSARRERAAINRDVDADTLSPAASTLSAQDSLEQLDRVTLVRDALARLPPSLREAVTLRDLQELSYLEIASRLGLPAGTVKSRLNRGRAALARALARHTDAETPPPVRPSARRPTPHTQEE